MKRITILAATLFALSGLQAQTGIDGVLRNIETNNKELQANAQLIASQKLETRTDNNLPDPTPPIQCRILPALLMTAGRRPMN